MNTKSESRGGTDNGIALRILWNGNQGRLSGLLSVRGCVAPSTAEAFVHTSVSLCDSVGRDHSGWDRSEKRHFVLFGTSRQCGCYRNPHSASVGGGLDVGEVLPTTSLVQSGSLSRAEELQLKNGGISAPVVTAISHRLCSIGLGRHSYRFAFQIGL